MTKLLMSKENPNGWKLEELLGKIRRELIEKNKLIQDDECQVSKIIQSNNKEIINSLADCIIMQNHSMEALDTLGENKGPLGEPRVGKNK